MNKLYIKLAGTNLVKNRLLYIPYILSGVVFTAFVYIMTFISQNEGLSKIKGSESLQSILLVGVWVTIIVAYLFIFYANSFLIKRRKKEFGVYNMLGMEKRHIARVLAMETFMAGFISIVVGLLCGILFSKFLLMLAYKILNIPQSIVFEVCVPGLIETAVVFGILFILVLIFNIMQVMTTKTIQLLSGSNVGEKEPKTKALMTIIGVVLLGGAYYISFTTENPVQVVGLFFVAVLMVIVGTYALFTAGSIATLKLLRKNKRYYYKKNHFAAVAGMIYRMKQNAAGLASICILSTMVLVMVSTTVSLYTGVDDTLRTLYPYDIEVEMRYSGADASKEGLLAEVDKRAEELAESGFEKHGAKMAQSFMERDGSSFTCTNANYQIGLSAVVLMTKADFEDTLGTVEGVTLPTIPKNTALLLSNKDFDYSEITLDGVQVALSGNMKFAASQDKSMAGSFDSMNYLLVNTDQELVQICGTRDYQHSVVGYYNVGGTDDKQREIARKLSEVADSSNPVAKEEKMFAGYVNSRVEGREDFYSMYGGFLFLGVFLGTLFLLITVLIIFFKQISEGYDDKHRFEIMKKVGMSRKEVKGTIRSQVRIVFFLPLVAAGIHVFAAFPMVERLLKMFNLTNTALFIKCLLATIGIFAVIYYLVFKITSQEYYKIVGSEAK